MRYPLTLTFKIVALAPQISVKDASGTEVCYVRQKLFKLKEKISVFTNSEKKDLLCEIQADRIIDFSGAYKFQSNGHAFGSVKRHGIRSLWRTHYEISDEAGPKYTVSEGNPWAKIFDGLVGNIPVVNLFSGYLFHPRYEVKDSRGGICYVLRKQPALFEGRFIIEETSERDDDILVLMSLMTITLLERKRG